VIRSGSPRIGGAERNHQTRRIYRRSPGYPARCAIRALDHRFRSRSARPAASPGGFVYLVIGSSAARAGRSPSDDISAFPTAPATTANPLQAERKLRRGRWALKSELRELTSPSGSSRREADRVELRTGKLATRPRRFSTRTGASRPSSTPQEEKDAMERITSSAKLRGKCPRRPTFSTARLELERLGAGRTQARAPSAAQFRRWWRKRKKPFPIRKRRWKVEIARANSTGCRLTVTRSAKSIPYARQLGRPRTSVAVGEDRRCCVS